MYNRVVQLWRRVQEYRSLLWGPSLLRSGRPGWCQKNPHFFQAPCQVTLNPLHILLHPCRRLLTECKQKLLGLQKPSVSNIVRRPNQRAEIHARGQVGSATGGPWAATSPWIQHLPLREIGQQEDLLANLMLYVFTYCWFEMTWK